MLSTQAITVCKTLHKLTTKLHVFNSRVQFLVLAFKHGLVDDIRNYSLWDRGYEALGERQFDACFELTSSPTFAAAQEGDSFSGVKPIARPTGSWC